MSKALNADDIDRLLAEGSIILPEQAGAEGVDETGQPRPAAGGKALTTSGGSKPGGRFEGQALDAEGVDRFLAEQGTQAAQEKPTFEGATDFAKKFAVGLFTAPLTPLSPEADRQRSQMIDDAVGIIRAIRPEVLRNVPRDSALKSAVQAARNAIIPIPSEPLTRTFLEVMTPTSTPLELAGTFLLPAGVEASKVFLREAKHAAKLSKGGVRLANIAVEDLPKPVATAEEATVRLEAAAAKAPKDPFTGELMPRPKKSAVPDRVVGINLDRMNTTTEVKEYIRSTAEANRAALVEAGGGTRSRAETLRLAQTMGIPYDRLVAANDGLDFIDVFATAARQNVVKTQEAAVEAANAFKAGRISGEEFIGTYRKSLDVLKMSKGISAKLARGLGSLNIKVDGDYARLAKQFLAEEGNAEFAGELAERLTRLDPLDTPGISKFMRNAAEGTFGDNIIEAWINGLLSGPVTHIVNTTSNALILASRPLLERPVRVGLDMLRSSFSGSPRARFMGEVAADIHGISAGVPEGARKALGAFAEDLADFASTTIGGKFVPSKWVEIVDEMAKAGKSAGYTTVSKLENQGQRAIRNKLLGPLIRIPGNALVAMDEFFKTIARSGEVNAIAYRSSVVKGLTGQARVNHIAAIINGTSKESEAIWKAAQQEARYRTFTKELGPQGKAIGKAIRRSKAGRVIIPFYRTPVNIAKFGLERTPLGFGPTAMDISQAWSKGGISGMKAFLKDPGWIDDVAKPVMGLMVSSVVAEAAVHGRITGGGPRQSSHRAALRKSGWMPYAIRIGDRYFSYGRLEPLGMVVGLTADAVELADITEPEDAVGKIGLAIAQNLSSKTFLRGLSDFLNAAMDPQRYGSKWLAGMAGSLVPTAVAQFERSRTGVLRRPSGVAEAVKARVPGLAGKVPVLRDIWGQVVRLPGSPVERLLSPIYRSDVIDDPATNAIIALGMGVGSPRREIKDIRLTAEQYDAYAELAGKLAHEDVTRLVESPGFSRLDDDRKENLIRSRIINARRRARSAMRLGSR